MGLIGNLLKQIENRYEYGTAYYRTTQDFIVRSTKKAHEEFKWASHFSINPAYEWVRNDRLMEYLFSPDFETFCIGYQILIEKGVIDGKDKDTTL